MRKQIGFAEVNTTRLYYEVAGSGHPLVLIHGGGDDGREWDDQFDAFAQQFKVVRHDLRGYGKSALPVPRESYTHADDLKALLEHLGIAQANILGRSMGGGIAIRFVLAYPEVARALILVSPWIVRGVQVSQEARSTLARWRTIFRESGVEAAMDFVLNAPYFRPSYRPILEKPDVARRFTQMCVDYTGWHLFNADPLRLPDTLAIQQLDRIDVSTLIIIGEHDIPDCITISGILEDRIPNAQRVVLPGTGHFPNMEDPKRFNETVLSFLADIC